MAPFSFLSELSLTEHTKAMKHMRMKSAEPLHSIQHFFTDATHCVQTLQLTNILICLTVDETVGVSFACTRHPEEKRIGFDHVTVTSFKLIAGYQQGWEGTRLGLAEIRVQRHLLFPRRHLLYRTADILREQNDHHNKKNEI